MKKRKSHPCSKATKEKLRNRIILPEWRRKQSEALMGHIISKETKKKISISMTGKTHSEKTKKKMRKAKIGKKNKNWKGGVSTENDLIRGRAEIREWKKRVFERDNWICQKTGERGCKLVAHHILSFADNKDIRTDVNNGTTLSQEAHKQFHNLYGNKDFTKEQLIEFINK